MTINLNLLLGLLALAGYAGAALAAAHALLHKRNPQSALAWVAFIVLVPYVGALCYILIGVRRVDSRANHLLAEAAEVLQAARQRGEGAASQILAAAGEVPEAHRVLANVGRQLTGRHPVGGNCLQLLRNGEQAYPQMLEAIEQAQSTVFLSTYIFQRGSAGGMFAETLGRAALRGVDVRVVVDGFGALFYSKGRPWRKAVKQGAKFKFFLPPRLLPPQLSINLRTHRKLLVCDGKVGFIGGMNISDHHLVSLPGTRAADVQVRCQGPVAALMHQDFLLDWAFVTKSKDTAPLPQAEPCGESFCRMVFDGLGKQRENIADLLCGVISGARKRVWIMTPYFLPPPELTGALTSAVLRGVDVRVLLPSRNNLFFVHRASRHIQPDLIRNGVQIHYQPEPFIHAKLLLIDDHYALIGSANLDPRSLFLNFEVDMEVFDRDLSGQLNDFFQERLDQSSLSQLEDYTGLKLRTRLLDSLFWLFSPYL